MNGNALPLGIWAALIAIVALAAYRARPGALRGVLVAIAASQAITVVAILAFVGLLVMVGL